jgi:hypothetical protein
MHLLWKRTGSSSEAVGAKTCQISSPPPSTTPLCTPRTKVSVRGRMHPLVNIWPGQLRNQAVTSSRVSAIQAGSVAAGHDTSCDCSHARGRRPSKTEHSHTPCARTQQASTLQDYRLSKHDIDRGGPTADPVNDVGGPLPSQTREHFWQRRISWPQAATPCPAQDTSTHRMALMARGRKRHRTGQGHFISPAEITTRTTLNGKASLWSYVAAHKVLSNRQMQLGNWRGWHALSGTRPTPQCAQQNPAALLLGRATGKSKDRHAIQAALCRALVGAAGVKATTEKTTAAARMRARTHAHTHTHTNTHTHTDETASNRVVAWPTPPFVVPHIIYTHTHLRGCCRSAQSTGTWPTPSLAVCLTGNQCTAGIHLQ